MLSRDEIDKRVDHHPPTPATVLIHEEWRSQIKSLMITANTILPAGRELAVTITHLEDALMWGNAAIARNET